MKCHFPQLKAERKWLRMPLKGAEAERLIWSCDSPTMSLSVSGSCLKSFLKSSLRCLYVGLSTCSDTHTHTHTVRGHTRTRTHARAHTCTHQHALHALHLAPPPPRVNLVKSSQRSDGALLWTGGGWMRAELRLRPPRAEPDGGGTRNPSGALPRNGGEESRKGRRLGPAEDRARLCGEPSLSAPDAFPSTGKSSGGGKCGPASRTTKTSEEAFSAPLCWGKTPHIHPDSRGCHPTPLITTPTTKPSR